MRNIYIHLGTPKTGTSIIQSHLQQNRRVLKDKGYYYPVTVSSDPEVYKTFESHHLLFYALADHKPFNRFSPRDYLEWLSSACQKHGLNSVLFSAENAWWLPTLNVREKNFDCVKYWNDKKKYIQTLSEFFQNYNVKLIVYLRRQDHWVESWYNQQIKNGFPVSDDIEKFGYEQDVYIDYKRNLDLWSEYFGRDNIIVRPYEKQQFESGLLNDFLSILEIGTPEEYPLHQSGRHNSKLDRDTMELMKLLNRTEMSVDERSWLKIALRKITNQFERQEVFKSLNLMDPESRCRLLEHYEDSNSAVAREYMNRENGLLFLEDKPAKNQEHMKYEGLPGEFLAQVFIKLLLERTNKKPDEIASTSKHSKNENLEPSSDVDLWNKYIWGDVID